MSTLFCNLWFSLPLNSFFPNFNQQFNILISCYISPSNQENQSRLFKEQSLKIEYQIIKNYKKIQVKIEILLACTSLQKMIHHYENMMQSKWLSNYHLGFRTRKGEIRVFSPQLATCIGVGILSYSFTHIAVTHLDFVKCKM